MKEFAVIGLGRFGTRLARLLAEGGSDVIAIDKRRDLVEAVRDDVARAVCLDATDEDALRSQAIDKVDVAVVGVGNEFESAVLTTVLLKQLGVPRVISRATSYTRARILSRVGADDIVNPEREAADRWLNRLVAPNLKDRIELAEGVGLVQASAPEKFLDKTLEELQIRRNYHVQIVAIRRTVEDTDTDGVKRSREMVISVPMADTKIRKNDVLMILGNDDAVRRLIE